MVLEEAERYLGETFKEAGVDASHGLEHARAVMGHVEKALQCNTAETQLSPDRKAAIRLAALLHDADDRKYFPKSKAYENARAIATRAGASEAVVLEMQWMIAHVSCSGNGNAIPEECRESPELLWPRWADRLEAIGKIGVVRCHLYSTSKGEKLFLETTPRPQSEMEALALATPERFQEYQESGGKSASMIDHYFDKLLHLAPAYLGPAEIGNAYLAEEMERRRQPLLDFVVAFGKEGKIPHGMIEEMRAEVGI